MKTQLIYFFFIINIVFCFAQETKFKLIDKIEKKPIKYANIKFQENDLGTSSDSLGNFIIDKNSKILINAVGYEKLNIDLSNCKEIIELNPKETLIPEIILFKRKNQNEVLIDEINVSKINVYYGLSANETKSWIVGKYFENKANKTKFLKSVRIITKSDIKNAKFTIRLYSTDKLGNPTEEIYQDNIISIAKKGKHKTEVNLEKTNLQIPDNGIFIALDWIKISENTYQYKYTTGNSKKKLLGKTFEPSFGAIPEQNMNKTRILINNIWQPALKDVMHKSDNYSILAMELILTD